MSRSRGWWVLGGQFLSWQDRIFGEHCWKEESDDKKVPVPLRDRFLMTIVSVNRRQRGELVKSNLNTGTRALGGSNE